MTQQNRCLRVWFLAAALLFVLATFKCTSAFAQRPFTAKDDVGMALFEYASGGLIRYSPDGKYFAVVMERGRLDLNAPEDIIWVFRTADVQRFAKHPDPGSPVAPMPLVQMASDKDGPLIENVRWLADSSGIAFTAPRKSSCCKFHQLFVADVRAHVIKPLTPEDQDVGEFDIRSDGRYVYEVSAPMLLTPRKEEERPVVALTGKGLWSILFPNDEQRQSPFDAAGLWAVIDGERR